MPTLQIEISDEQAAAYKAGKPITVGMKAMPIKDRYDPKYRTVADLIYSLQLINAPDKMVVVDVESFPCGCIGIGYNEDSPDFVLIRFDENTLVTKSE